MEDSLKNSTVGLVKLEELLSTETQGIGGKPKRGRLRVRMSSSKSCCSIISLAEGKAPFSAPRIDGLFYVENLLREEQKEVKKRKKSAKATPSFALDDEADGADAFLDLPHPTAAQTMRAKCSAAVCRIIYSVAPPQMKIEIE